MSLIIKDVGMPPKCRFCPCCADNGLIGMQREYFCSAVDSAPEIDNLDQKLSICPLIEIPTPHGRLIYADELLKAFKKACEQDGHWVNFFALVESAPTIIEAEVSE